MDKTKKQHRKSTVRVPLCTAFLFYSRFVFSVKPSKIPEHLRPRDFFISLFLYVVPLSLCNYNFVRICCEYSLFLLISDEYFYFQFGMCAFYGYFHCIAVFDCLHGEYSVSVDI